MRPSNPSPHWDFLDGKRYRLDGVEGRFKVTAHYISYPYERVEYSLEHLPSPKGKRSRAYRAMRSELGDDWVTDLSWSEDMRDVAIAQELGYEDEG